MRNAISRLWVAACVGMSALTSTATAGEDAVAAHGAATTCPGIVCPRGYTIVEEVCYKEVVRSVCRMVPETHKVKKVVYDVKETEYCLPKCGKCSSGCWLTKCFSCCQQECDEGGECGKVRCRKTLVKREVEEEECVTRCVIENVVEQVPYRVRKMVPCSRAPPCESACSDAPGAIVAPAAPVESAAPPATLPDAAGK